MTDSEAPVAQQRAYGDLYQHLREWHGISPAVLGRHRTLRDLERYHEDLGDEGCVW